MCHMTFLCPYFCVSNCCPFTIHFAITINHFHFSMKKVLVYCFFVTCYFSISFTFTLEFYYSVLIPNSNCQAGTETPILPSDNGKKTQ